MRKSFWNYDNIFGRVGNQRLKKGDKLRQLKSRSLLLEPLEQRQLLSVGQVCVDTTSDIADGITTSITALYANKGPDGVISLREAILAANNTVNSLDGPDEISFNIQGAGVHTISPTTALPAISDAVVIDGYTQPGATANILAVGNDAVLKIELNGTYTSYISGLNLNPGSSGSIIRGLIVNQYGVGIEANSDNNLIIGNFIGTNAAGSEGNGNLAGISLYASNNQIGGTAPSDRNIIGSNDYGIEVYGDANLIIGNYIGTDATGAGALGGLIGIGIYGGSDNVIGGTATGASNVISGNFSGVSIEESSSNTIVGNYIGTNAAGTDALGNSYYGIYICSNSLDNTIGGTEAGAGNVISYNGCGVSVLTSTYGTGILGNSISSNSGRGIDLDDDGITANDLGDADAGANNLQNFPVLASVTSGSGSLTIQGTLNSVDYTSYRIEFFANTTADPSGYGEGQRYLGSFNVTTDGSGNVNFTQVIYASVAVGEYISATATNLTTNDTSEFAQCITAAAPDISVTPIGGLTTTEAGGQAQFSVVLTSAPSAEVTIGIASSDAAEGTASPTNIIFHDSNWNIPQTVTVTGLSSNSDNGNVAYTIVTAPAVSTDGNYEGLDPANISVVNIHDNMDLTVVGNQIVNEGQLLSLTDMGIFSDPDFGPSATFTYQIDWGDNSSPQSGEATIDIPGEPGIPTQGSFDGAHTYSDNGVYTISVRLTDEEGGQDIKTFQVTVNNVAPVVTLTPSFTTDTGGHYQLIGGGSFIDPGQDNWTILVDYGEGAGPEILTYENKSFAFDHTYSSNSPFTVQISVSDGESDPRAITFEAFQTSVNDLGDVIIGQDCTLVLNPGSGGIISVTGVISGSGSLTKTGGGTLTLTGNNSYSGGTTINGGTLQIGNGGASGRILANISNNSQLVINRSGNLTLAGIISGSGNLTKTGSGTLTISANNTYTGATTIKQGTLIASKIAVSSGTSSLGNATSQVVLGDTEGHKGILSYTGGSVTYTRGFTVQSGGGEINTATAGQYLNIATGGIANGGPLSFGGASNLTISSIISGSGSLTKVGGTLTLSGNNTYTGGTVVNGGTLQVGSNTAFGAGSLTMYGSGLTLGGYSLVVQELNGDSNSWISNNSYMSSVTLQINQGGFFQGQINGGGVGLSLRLNGGMLILSGNNTYISEMVINGGTLQLGSDTALGGSKLTMNGGALDLAGHNQTLQELNGDSSSQIINSGEGTPVTLQIDGPGYALLGNYQGQITDNGTGEISLHLIYGTLILSGNNSYSGGTEIYYGTLKIGSDTALGSGNLMIYRGTLDLSGHNLEINELNGEQYYGGWITNSSNENATLQINQMGFYQGRIKDKKADTGSGGSLTLRLMGLGGLQNLIGYNTYTGGTEIYGGTVQIGSNSAMGNGNLTMYGGALDLAGRNLRVKEFNGDLDTLITNSSATSSTLQIDQGGFSQGLISDKKADTGAGGSLLLKLMGGTLTLSGNNTYTGGTTITSGTLQLGDGVHNGSLVGPITNNSSLVFNNQSTLACSSQISGYGSLTKIGAGTLILTATSPFTGTTTIDSGVLQLGDGTNDGSLAGPITDNGSLVLDNTGTVTFANPISGSGSLTKTGYGDLVLSGNNSYSGGTYLTGGMLILGDIAAVPSNTALTINGSALLDLNGYDISAAPLSTVDLAKGSIFNGTLAANSSFNLQNGMVAANLAGAAGLVKSGTGEVVLAGTNTYLGTTSALEGTLVIATDNSLPPGTVVSGPGTVRYPQTLYWYSGDGNWNTGDWHFYGGALTSWIDGSNAVFTGGGNIEISGSVSALSVTFASGDYTIAGGQFSVPAYSLINTGPGTVTISSDVMGDGLLDKTGSGMLALVGAPAFAGACRVLDGTFNLNLTAMPAPPLMQWAAGDGRLVGPGSLKLQDPALYQEVQSHFDDQSINRNDMIAILQGLVDRLVMRDATLSAVEFSDLQKIVADPLHLYMLDYVYYLSSAVIKGSPGNALYQEEPLGDLTVGSTHEHLTKLIDKWFYGKDHISTGYPSIVYSEVSGPLFDASGPDWTDMQQGGLQDCVLIARIGALANASPDYIRDMFIDNGDNTWTIRFYYQQNGQIMTDYVTVDRYLPACMDFRAWNGWTPRWAGVIVRGMDNKSYNDSNELWLPLLEKGYWQWSETMLRGHFSDIFGDFTGYGGMTVTDKAAMRAALDNHYAVVLGSVSCPLEKYNLVAGHAYAIIGYYYDSVAGDYRFIVRNPWGSYQPGDVLSADLESIQVVILPRDNDTAGILVQEAQPLGGEFRVNTTTDNIEEDSAVAMDAAGNFVIAWQSSNQNGGSQGIYAQRYNAAGMAQGSEIHIDIPANVSQYCPAVAMDAAGNFVIAWQSYDWVSNNYGIYAQRYNAAGVAQGNQFRVNTYIPDSRDYPHYPSVAMDAAGNFVVAWTSYTQDGSDNGISIYAQRYNAAGVAQGDEFRVNTYTTNSQSSPAMAMDSEGNLVIAWQSMGQDSSDMGIYAQRYNAAGAAQGVEFRVNTHTLDYQTNPAVAMDAAGNFVITWQSNNQDGDNWGIYAQRYNATGAAQGGEFQVNTFTLNYQEYPTVAMDAVGNFVIAWQSDSHDSSNTGIYAQYYNAAGFALGSEFRVNTYSYDAQYCPVAVMDANGTFVITWTSDNQDGSFSDIYAQRYRPNTLQTTEAGGTATFTAVLNSQPAADVIIPISSSDTSEGTVSTSSLTFTTSNWNTPQTVTITGVDDYFHDGDLAYSILTGAATSADNKYNGLNATDVSVSNSDNDTYNIIWVDTAQDVNDTGLGDCFTIAQLYANQGSDGKISLREAILAANNTTNGSGGPDRIYFNIGTGGLQTIYTDMLPGISDAIFIDGYTQGGASVNTLTVGSNAVLAIAINGNDYAMVGASGIFLDVGSSGSTIRGLVINYFDQSGIEVLSDNNTIAGNYLGANPAGTEGKGNFYGVHVTGANNMIGSVSPADRNLVSSNSMGIGIDGASATGTLIKNNYIGTNAAGAATLGNGSGIYLSNCENITIGGTNSSETNVISGNMEGVCVINVDSITIAGNYIGTNAAGAFALGNYFAIRIYDSHNGIIGGVTAGAGNVIKNNTGAGVALDNNTTGFSILGNSIDANGGLGIDLNENGLTPNDVGDADSGANNFQNFPLLTGAIAGSGYLTVKGTLNSTANSTFRIEFFVNSTTDPSGYGEGQRYLGAFNVTTNASGDVSYNENLTAIVAPGEKISATATNTTTNDTSEFAQCVAAAGITVAPISGLTTTEAAGMATFTVVLNSQPTTSVTIPISSSAATEGTVSSASLIFNDANWNIPQTVTITGISSNIDSGNIEYNIVTAPAISSDGNYDGLDAANVVVVNVHDNMELAVVSNQTVNEGQLLSLTDLGTFCDPDFGPSEIFTYQIDWGDNSSPQSGAATIDIPGEPGILTQGSFDGSHTYADNGVYTVTVTLTDDNGGQDVKTFQVTVNNVAPDLALSGERSVSEGSPYTLHLSATDPGADAIQHWDINWGDGNVEMVSGNPFTVQHCYVVDGDYLIRATATDEDGTYITGAVGIAGELDVTFGTGGKVTTDISGSDINCTAMVVQSDGKIVAAGYTYSDFVLLRYNSNGALDPTFDGDGKLTTNFGGDDRPYAIAIQSDGKIVVAGTSGDNFALARYNINGSLDTSFDGDGKLTTDFSGNDTAHSIGILSNGKIVLSGRSNDTCVLACYNTDGSLDTSFDGDGKLITNYYNYGSNGQKAILIQSDKIVAAYCGDSYSLILARYNADGSLDSSFGANGTTQANLGAFYPWSMSALVVQSDGKIVAGGAVLGSEFNVVLARFTSNGLLDSTFGANGKVIANYNTSSNTYVEDGYGYGGSYLYGLDLQADDKLVAVGAIGNDDFTVIRYQANGALDTDFGVNGFATTDFSGEYDNARAVTVLENGKILVAGHATDNGSQDFALMSINPGVVDFPVTVTNMAPMVTLAPSFTTTGGGNYQLIGGGSFIDPGQDNWTILVDYGEGAGPEILTYENKSFAFDHTYSSNSPFTVQISVSDGESDPRAITFEAFQTSVNDLGDIIIGQDCTLVLNPGSGCTITVSGVIIGEGGLTKTGGGTLILSGNNTYTGGTEINGGTLRAGSNTALGCGNLTMYCGGLDVAGRHLEVQELNGAAGTWITDCSGTWSEDSLQINQGGSFAGFITDEHAAAGYGGHLSLRLNGGTLTLSGNNTYTGGTEIKQGTLSVSNIVLSGGACNLGNSMYPVVLGDTAGHKGILSYTGDPVTYTRGFAVRSGGGEIDHATAGQTLTIAASGIAVGGPLTIAGPGNTIISSQISGNGSLIKAGSGTLTLNFSYNDFKGGTEINGGTLIIDNLEPLSYGNLTLNGGVLDLAGHNLQVKQLNGNNSSSSITNSSEESVTLQIDQGGSCQGYITDKKAETGAGGSVSLKLMGGTLTLSNNNTYTGGTTITGGTLQLGDGAHDGSLVGPITNYSSLVFNNQSTLVYSNPISGGNTNSLTKSGAGTLILTATSPFTGTTTINSGVLQLGDGTNDGSLAGPITNNSSLVLANARTLTLTKPISGTGSLTKTGYGDLVLSGNNTYSGGTYINNGMLDLDHVEALPGNTTLTIDDGAFLNLNDYDISATPFSAVSLLSGYIVNGTLASNTSFNLQNGVVSANLAGASGLIKSGPGQVVLAGSNTYLGSTSVLDGTLVIATDNALPTGTVVNGPGTVSYPETLYRDGGDGSWNTTDECWHLGSPTGSLTPWSNGSNAVFSGGGNIEISDSVSAFSVTFASGDYTITGGQLSVPIYSLVDTGSATVSISSDVVGNGALEKTGSGKLTLVGTPVFDGACGAMAGTFNLNFATMPAAPPLHWAASNGGIIGPGAIKFQNSVNYEEVQSLFDDQSIDRNDMIAILQNLVQRLTLQETTLSAVDLSDLQNIVANPHHLNMSDYVQVLASDVVMGNPANDYYQGEPLGNLEVGSDPEQLTKLINEWFYGKDYPSTAPYNVSYSYVHGTLYDANGPGWTDMQQGRIPDCWLIAALGGLAHASRDYEDSENCIKNMIIDNGDDTWTIRFYYNNGDGTVTADYVTVDRYLPVNSIGNRFWNGWTPGYPEAMENDCNNDGNELWLPLVEKAYWQWYETGRTWWSGHWAFGAVLGDTGTYVTDKTAMRTALDNHYAVALHSLSCPLDVYDIVPGHAYAIIDYIDYDPDPLVEDIRFVLKNPWGSSQPLDVRIADLESVDLVDPSGTTWAGETPAPGMPFGSMPFSDSEYELFSSGTTISSNLQLQDDVQWKTDQIIGGTLTVGAGEILTTTPNIRTLPVYLPGCAQRELIPSANNRLPSLTPISAWSHATSLYGTSENRFENLLPDKQITEARIKIFASWHDKLPLCGGIITKGAKTKAAINQSAHYLVLQTIGEKADVSADLDIIRYALADKKAKHSNDAVDAVLAEGDVVLSLLVPDRS